MKHGLNGSKQVHLASENNVISTEFMIPAVLETASGG